MDDLPDFTSIPLPLYLRAQMHIIYQLASGALLLALSLWIAIPLLAAIFKIFAAVALVIGIANCAAAITEWRALKKNNFAAIAKITQSAPIGEVTVYKVEFKDPEGTRREGTIVSQSWEKTTFKPGDKLKILYNPRDPQELINYSAYEALKQ